MARPAPVKGGAASAAGGRVRALIPRGERCQTWKLSPQPQRPFSFGLVKVKPAESAFCS